ncbi:MAG: transcriptional regulator [Elusimicrobia bacterium RIFCSPLOWO2_01_FULL_60_11]|nr:MAG: transcriptional regulator [Elusimicrobia bacterium RIFCSPLOWO2_01_FULL_60_11]
MSGHSRWAGIKHKKAITDSKKGKTFTKLAREISVAAKAGGGNPDHNARLRKAIEDAREANMPQDNVKKAIQKGTGEIPGVTYEEVRYEGYGQGGVALLVDCTTDSRNRTAPEIRKIFSSHGGNMAESGAVGWIFSSKGYITVDKKSAAEEDLLDLALEAGAEDMKTTDEDAYEITTAPHDFEKVKAALKAKNIPVSFAEVTLLPGTTVPVTGSQADQVLALVRDLEDHDDVKTVFANFDIPKELLEKAG